MGANGVDRSLHLRGVRLRYLEWGRPDAPSVVLLHGITGHARTWDREAAALAAGWHVIALDQRGHGDSGPAPDGDYTLAALADDLAALLPALGPPSASRPWRTPSRSLGLPILAMPTIVCVIG